jgi:hypothetical protein
VRIVTEDDGEDWDAGARSIEFCAECGVIHFRLYRSVSDKEALMCIDIPPEGLDSLVADLVKARNQWRAAEIISTHETMQ